MCHSDHPHTLTSPATTTHENNVYLDATTQTTRASGSATRIGSGAGQNRARTDFDTTLNVGLCASCHQKPILANGITVGRGHFGASAHDFATNAVGATTYTWTFPIHDGSTFARNCTKCHASRVEGNTPTSTTTLAVHYSDTDPNLLAGTTNPAGTAANFACYNCHGSTATPVAGAQGNRSGKDIQSQILHATTADQSGHPSNSDTVHASAAEFTNAAFGNSLGVAAGAGQRHASCLDCHDSHEARPTSGSTRVTGSATNGNVAGPALQGAWGAQLSSNPGFWTAPTSANFTKKTMVAGTDLQATLCFKCHTGYYWGTGTPPISPSGFTYTTGTATAASGGTTVTGSGTTWTAAHVGANIRNNTLGVWHKITAFTSATSITISPAATAAWSGAYTIQMAESDMAKEFNPANVGNFAGTGTTIVRRDGRQLPSGPRHRGEQPGSHQQHQGALDPDQPHDLLRLPRVGHDNRSHRTPRLGGPIHPQGTEHGLEQHHGHGFHRDAHGTFCINCHEPALHGARASAEHFSRSNHRIACFNCHAAIPHGGPRPGLLVAGAGAAASVGGTIAGWDTAAPYWQGTTSNRLYIASYPANNTTAWQQGNCGCNGTGH